jgi:coenzyme F420-0:L-glutamate ligase
MKVTPIKTAIFNEGENLLQFIIGHLSTLSDKSVIVVTSKVVALAERRTAPLAQKAELIRSESQWCLQTALVHLTFKDGLLMAAAGIDESNADGKLILLPQDSFAAAEELRKALMEHFGLKDLGVLITDSHTSPLRRGVTGIALGYAGFKGLHDYRKETDLFGRPFRFSSTNLADSLAAAAVCTMGEGAECLPLAIIEEAPVQFCAGVDRKELIISPEEDMYAPLLKAMTAVS